MASEQVDPQWRRPRGVRAVHVVAVLSALLAAGGVFGLFSRFGVVEVSTKAQPQLIASIDLRIGDPVRAAARGEAKAQADVEAGLLHLQTFGLTEPPTKADLARAGRLKQRYGIVWINRGSEATPQTQAYADAYNRVMQAEIGRRHGKAFVGRLMQSDDRRNPRPDL